MRSLLPLQVLWNNTSNQLGEGGIPRQRSAVKKKKEGERLLLMPC